LTRPHFWIFFLFFFISSSPLIIRNYVVYGTPLYEGHNSNAPWLDSWEEVLDPKYEMILEWGTGTYSTKALPTMRSYMQTHSIAELVERAVRGIKGESRLVLNSMSMEVGSKVEPYYISLIVLFFVLGVIGDQNRKRIVIPIATLVIFFLPFAWYFQVIPSSRFIAPLIPILCMYTALGLIIALRYFDESVVAGRGKVSLAKWVPAVLTVFLVLIAGYILKTPNVNLVSEPIRLSEDQEELFSWMRDNVEKDDVVFMTPTNRYWGLLWVKGFKGKLVVVNKLGLSEESMATLDEFLKKRNVSIVILHQQNYSSLEPVMEYVVYNDSDGLIEKRAITGWKFAYKHSEKPTKFLIYQLDTT
jgi:hypothetical protein